MTRPTNIQKGDRFDFFGQVFEVLKVYRNKSFLMGEMVADAFGKYDMINVKEYRYADLKVMGMRRLENE